MGKASAHWYTKEGAQMHNVAKGAIMEVARGGSFTLLKQLACINMDWFQKTQDNIKVVCPQCNNGPRKNRCPTCRGRGYDEVPNPEYVEPSLPYLVQMNECMWKPMAPCLKGTPIIERMILKRVQYFVLALYHSDDMYYERIGWLIGEFAKLHWSTSKKTRFQMMDDLYVLEAQYFVNEHRQDRILHLRTIWKYVLNYIDTHEWAFEVVCWYSEYLDAHPWVYYDEVSRHGLQAFHPENWYPVGRGRVWDIVHGGQG